MDKNDVAELEVTHELHNIRSALLLYHGLLKDFEHSVEFIRDHPNPALLRASGPPAAEKSNELLKRECHYLLTEIKRLQGTKDMCRERVANAFDLVRALVGKARSQAADTHRLDLQNVDST